MRIVQHSLTLALAAAAAACGDDDDEAPAIDTTDDVVEVAVRRLNPQQDVAAFERARDDFVDLLKQQPGVGTDREFEGFVDFSTQMPPNPPIFVGMTQYEDLAAFTAAGQALGSTPEAGAFFSTFTPAAFTPLQPLVPGTTVNLAGIASGANQILEVAVRDLSDYANFDPAAYAQARDDFLDLLRAQNGVVAEFQWVSAVDPNVAVGMTVYEDQAAFMRVNTDPALLNAPETAAFLRPYPPSIGVANTVVR